jgi:predicted phosphohydrolase
MRVICISDTHSRHDDMQVPEGDLLLHAGDCSKLGTREQIESFDRWLGTLPHPHKVVIAGNHDFAFEQDPEARSWITNATYLQDEGVEIGGLFLWGSPWQPRFFDWAFNLDRGEPLRRVWAKIPPKTDILLTHGPPYGILDATFRGQLVGCEELLEVIGRLRPRLHVFGHIHEAYGVRERQWEDGRITRFVNASICTLSRQPSHRAVVVEL